jgi:hypothetical protein
MKRSPVKRSNAFEMFLINGIFILIVLNLLMWFFFSENFVNTVFAKISLDDSAPNIQGLTVPVNAQVK